MAPELRVDDDDSWWSDHEVVDVGIGDGATAVGPPTCVPAAGAEWALQQVHIMGQNATAIFEPNADRGTAGASVSWRWVGVFALRHHRPGLKGKTPLHRELGQRVCFARLDRGLSQEALALEAGINRTYIGSLESGERNPALGTVARLARALGVDLGGLVAGLEHLEHR